MIRGVMAIVYRLKESLLCWRSDSGSPWQMVVASVPHSRSLVAESHNLAHVMVDALANVRAMITQAKSVDDSQGQVP